MSFTVYRSSAGSGKTFVLVKEYLKIILGEPDDFRHILAITFTNKAANEMKERVLKNLSSLSQWQEHQEDKKTDELIRILSDETGLTKEVIAERSGRVLRTILHHYSDFAIGTIDSFFHRIIRTFAHDFHLPVNFNVELDTDSLLTTAVDLLIDRVGDDPQLTALLRNFVESRMEEQRDWDIGKILVDFAINLMDEQAIEHLPGLKNLSLDDFSGIARSVYARIHSFEKKIRDVATEAFVLIQNRGIPLSAFASGERGIGGYLERLAAGNFDKIRPNTYVMKTIGEDKWSSGKATASEKEDIRAISGALAEACRKIINELEGNYPVYRLLKLITRSLYPLAVLSEIGKILNEFKKQNHLIHISEFNARIAEIVLGEPVPFIYERVGEKYHHLLIDEFQDTSALQWQNFVPLLENSLSLGHFNLLVGDGKQAIYRWRNGDVEQFARLPQLPLSDVNPVVKEREDVLRSHFHEERLGKNFRSGRTIVELNNDFFVHLSKLLDPPRAKVYEKPLQDAVPEKGAGYIRIEFLEDPGGVESFRELTFRRTADVVRECRSEGLALKDLVVLCRSNRNASEMARYLAGEGFPVVSSESLLLSYSPNVRFLVAMIRYLSEQENPVLKAELLAWLYNKGLLGDSSFHELMESAGSNERSGKDFIKILSDHGIILRKDFLRALPLYDLCEELIRLFYLNTTRDPYLEFFREHILKFTLKDPAGASRFLEWWDVQKEKLSVIIPEGMDAVRIMTIHKAKGLQFPVVIFPFATDVLRNTRKYLWVDLEQGEVPGLTTAILPTSKEMDETRFAGQRVEEEQKSLLDMINLLYVVMTRAEARLYVLTADPPASSDVPASYPAFFSTFLSQKMAWNETQRVYEFGVKEISGDVSYEEKTQVEETSKVIPEGWRERIFIRSHAPDVWDIQDPERNRRYGNLLHTVMSKIMDYDDAERVLEMVRYEGLAGSELLEGIRAMVKQLMENPEIRPFFEPGKEVRAESEILLQDGNVLRPDRVILDGSSATVIDYKSGKPSEKYRSQLEIYEKHLLGMGYSEVTKYLIYLEPEVRVVRV